MDLPLVADIIKDTKVGQGLKFLPTKLNDLSKKLPLLLTELAEVGSLTIKNKITGILEELLRRGGISLKNYNAIREENEIL